MSNNFFIIEQFTDWTIVLKISSITKMCVKLVMVCANIFSIFSFPLHNEHQVAPFVLTVLM